MVQRQCGTHPRAEQEGDIGAASVVRASVLMGNTRPVFPHPLQKTFGASHALRASVLIKNQRLVCLTNYKLLDFLEKNIL